MIPQTEHDKLIEAIDQDAMLADARSWSAVNTGTANLEGLSKMAGMLADAFSTLPGEIELIDPAPVTAISPKGEEIEQKFGQHMVLRVRPDAERRLLFTGHMDTVFPKDHPFQEQQWLDDETLNGPGLADMKGGIAVILHALRAFEQSEHASRIGYDVMINADEETGSLSSAGLIERLVNKAGGVRSEATIQSDVRMLLLDPELGLDDDDLEVHLEAQVGPGRRIDVEIGCTVIEVKKSLASPSTIAAATVMSISSPSRLPITFTSGPSSGWSAAYSPVNRRSVFSTICSVSESGA